MQRTLWANAMCDVHSPGSRTLLQGNNVIAVILKVLCQIENPTSSVDAYLLKNNLAKFNPNPI